MPFFCLPLRAKHHRRRIRSNVGEVEEDKRRVRVFRKPSIEIYETQPRKRVIRYIDEVPEHNPRGDSINPQPRPSDVETEEESYGVDPNNGMQYKKDDKVDIIIFGATGALGSYTVLQAVDQLSSLKWGIAGRNRRNLQAVLRNVTGITGKNCETVPIFIVDATDKKSLLNMASKCDVVVNCCGAYETHALAVIGACIEAGKHYVDACVEPALLKKIHDKFNFSAQEKHVYIVNSCGFQSFIVDVGMNYVESHFDGIINSVEAYTQFCKLKTRQFVPVISCAIFQSVISAMANCKQYLGSETCSCSGPKISYGSPIAKSDAVDGISIPMPIIDAQTVQRTQEYLKVVEDKRPIQFRNYMTFPSYITAFIALIWCIVMFILAQTPGTREMLLRYPRIFTFGMCSTDCLDRTALSQLVFTVTFKARGWYVKRNSLGFEEGNCLSPDPHCNSSVLDGPPNKTLKVKICGSNPFYEIGCIALLSSATTIVKHIDQMPEFGGIYTPGAAFRGTEILHEAVRHNSRFKFKVIED